MHNRKHTLCTHTLIVQSKKHRNIARSSKWPCLLCSNFVSHPNVHHPVSSYSLDLSHAISSSFLSGSVCESRSAVFWRFGGKSTAKAFTPISHSTLSCERKFQINDINLFWKTIHTPNSMRFNSISIINNTKITFWHIAQTHITHPLIICAHINVSIIMFTSRFKAICQNIRTLNVKRSKIEYSPFIFLP